MKHKIIIWIFVILFPFSVSRSLELLEIATGLDQPVFVTSAPNDSSRLFIVEQEGFIRILQDDSLLTAPFLNIQHKVSCCEEQGLLSIAFHPNYDENGYLFISYTNNSSSTVISRYSVSGDPNIIDFTTEVVILNHFQQAPNHNGGMLAFSPIDSYLYFGFGDGGGAGDFENDAQTGTNLLGKMIRINVDSTLPYTIPADNPFVATVDTLPEIWAFGVRNPWRFSFDSDNGNLIIADVGQEIREEINLQLASSSGGENYGWRLKEGSLCYDPPTSCDTLTYLTEPVYEYNHGGSPFKCSITGGYVYRGCKIPELRGRYFFADYCGGIIWSLEYDGATLTNVVDHSSELGLVTGGISSFGQDNNGELYVVAHGQGKIYQLISPASVSDCTCCLLPGDSNKTGDVDIADLTFTVNFMFKGGSAPFCLEEGDLNNSCGLDISDLTYRVNWMFKAGPAPLPCNSCS